MSKMIALSTEEILNILKNLSDILKVAQAYASVSHTDESEPLKMAQSLAHVLENGKIPISLDEFLIGLIDPLFISRQVLETHLEFSNELIKIIQKDYENGREILERALKIAMEKSGASGEFLGSSRNIH